MWYFITKRGFKIHHKITSPSTTHICQSYRVGTNGEGLILCNRWHYGSQKRLTKGPTAAKLRQLSLSISISLIQSSGFSLERKRERERVDMAEVLTLKDFSGFFYLLGKF